MIPQLILASLSVVTISVAIGDAKHGKPGIGATVFGVVGLQALLYWGGWYDQIIARLFN